MNITKFAVSTALLLFMQLSAATGFTVFLDELNLIHSQWYHVLIGFMVFNASLFTFLRLNNAEVSISAHLDPDAKSQARINRQLKRYAS